MPIVAAGLLALRVVLAGVFLLAGAAKLADRAGSRQAMLDFGVPERLASAAGALLPVAELATACALLPVATARWGALAALALLALFTAAVAVAIARGRAPACRCFGQLSSAPVGPRTLVRNGLLLAAAGFLAVRGWNDPGPSAMGLAGWVAAPARLAVAGTLGGLLFGAAIVVLMIEMLRQQGRILLRLEALEQWVTAGQAGALMPSAATAPPVGLPVGAPAPAFSLRDLAGTVTDLPGLLALGRPLLLLFVHPRCGPCEALLPEIAQWQRAADGALTLPLISEGSLKQNRAMAEKHGLTAVLRQRASEVGTAYQAFGTPSAVLVQSDGTIASPVAGGADAIRALVGSVLGSRNGHTAPSPAPAGLRPGDAAPPFELPGLDGRHVRLDDASGAERLLVSWNPSCGFCGQLLEPLKAWEARTPASSLKMLVIARGDAAEMAAAGFRSPVGMDHDGSVSRAYGMSGTPMAVLVDARGVVASEVAAGAGAILQLIERRTGAATS
ncbi:MAG: MauE/DoxX family redox-associated membrane protein [bacterium]